jgi:hypothetical protein
MDDEWRKWKPCASTALPGRSPHHAGVAASNRSFISSNLTTNIHAKVFSKLKRASHLKTDDRGHYLGHVTYEKQGLHYVLVEE